MSKKNYKVILTANQPIGKVGQEVAIRKGYARFLYRKDRALHIIGKTNLKNKVIKGVVAIIDLVKQIKDIEISKNNESDLQKHQVNKFSIKKILGKQVKKNIDFLDIQIPEIKKFGSCTAEVVYLKDVVHSLEVKITQKSDNA